MKNKIKLFLLLSSVFVMVYWSSCTPDDVVKPPYKPDCAVLYPTYNGTVDTSVFYFEWCEIEGATKYRVQANEDFSVGEPFLYDTIVQGTRAKSTRIYQSSNDPTLFSEGTPFKWGETYHWRVAPVINGVQRDWSEVYEFQTWDARDKVVGIYTANKYIYLTNRWGNNSLDSSFGTAEIKIEKVPNSKNILFTEIGGHNLTKEMQAQWSGNSWSVTENVYPNFAEFNMQNDSFTVVIMTNPANNPPWGYYFGGFK
jgi:hypothetical protein